MPVFRHRQDLGSPASAPGFFVSAISVRHFLHAEAALNLTQIGRRMAA
jgi:hypothetical protein